jgi:uncharacterized membrane protein
MSNSWRTIALVSLALNLLIAGTALGGYAAGARFSPPGADRGPSRAERPIRAIIAAVEPERRPAVRREIARTFAAAREARKEARDARMSLTQTIRAEPYDVAAVRAAFARMRAADQALAQRFQDLTADQLAAMTPEERRRIIGVLLQRRERGVGRKGEGMPLAPQANDSP